MPNFTLQNWENYQHMEAEERAFLRLRTIMDELRLKCPWDQKQTIHSLRSLTLEETYELAEAIIEEDWSGIKEELGDVLLHIIFYAKIANERQAFTLAEMINQVCDKLVHRHPHIYADVVVENEEEVKRNWEKLKLAEGKKSVLQGVPKGLPAIVKAMRLQSKAKQVGFEWDNTSQVWEKVEEEISELKQAIENKQQDEIEEEFGDVLFSLINYARFINVDAEAALEKVNRKFTRRFSDMEALAEQKGQQLSNLTLQEMNNLWNQIKVQNKQH